MGNKEVSEKSQEIQVNLKNNLNPTEVRIMDNKSYFLMQVGGSVNIAVFAIGSSMIGALNIYQAFAAIIVGVIIASALRTFNGKAGQEYGIPFAIQLRTSFGILGSKLPSLIRMLPALVWYSFQSWVGATAINAILGIWFNFDNIFICFVLFQSVHIFFTIIGFEGVKWIENVGAVFIMVALAYMFFITWQKYGLSVGTSVVNIKGTWSIGWVAAIVVFAGDGMGLTANSSDIVRNYQKDASYFRTFFIYFIGQAPAFLFMGMIGLIATGATGIADPINIFIEVFDSPLLLIITMLFVIFSQLTTNIIANALPVVYVMMDTFKISYIKAVLFSGIVPLFLMPWKLVNADSASGLNLFIQILSLFLAPLIVVMLMDYYVIRKQRIDLDAIYDTDGPYKGINYAGIIAIIVGAAIGFIRLDISWIISTIPTALLYYGLMIKLPSSKRFLPKL